MCSEFWDGWFDYWGGHHHTTDASLGTGSRDLLAAGASVNIYMFHGGTNFGFTNGANDKGVYQPTVTSYDYDAPLDEAGNPTEKFWAFREVLSKYTELDDADVPAAPAAAAELVVPSPGTPPLWDCLDSGPLDLLRDVPQTTDDIGHYSGFSLYRNRIDVQGPGVLVFGEVRDRAQVFLDRKTLARCPATTTRRRWPCRRMPTERWRSSLRTKAG